MAFTRVFYFLTLAVFAGSAEAGECLPTALDLRDNDSTLRFAVEIADDEMERSQGLMFRESLPQFGGMLFVYEAPHDAVFWMKNTYIPLDMLFFDEAGKLLSIVESAEPLTLDPRNGGAGVKYVLEINGGLVKKLGLELGAEFRHPAVDAAKAAWPCE